MADFDLHSTNGNKVKMHSVFTQQTGVFTFFTWQSNYLLIKCTVPDVKAVHFLTIEMLAPHDGEMLRIDVEIRMFAKYSSILA
ncbi:MAG: hypothetical protein PHV32_10585 [Eubacteriales bacterium]|nr:hypothetical protein [Eubacteriales bacterium]